jgi:hypothetical protein
MLASRKQTQHADSIGGVAGLAQDFCVYDHDGIGAKNKFIGPVAKHSESFFACHPFGERLRRFSTARNFGNIGRLHHERNSRVSQKILAARRGRGEYQHAG